VYCPECFLLDASGGGTYTFQNCPGKVGGSSVLSDFTTTDGSTSCTGGNACGHYVRQYQFINVAGAASIVKDTEASGDTPDISLAIGESKTVMCYNGNLYKP
jgi:hypothetical protein